MKKILFITNYFGNGGAAMVLKTLAEYFANNNEFEVEILSLLDDDKKYEIPNNTKYACIDIRKIKGHFKKVLQIIKLRKKIKKIKPNVIVSFEYFVNMQTIIADFGIKNKLIISERNDPAREGHNKRFIRNFLYNFANVLVCQTDDAKAYFPKLIQRKSVVILNPLKPGLPEPWTGERKKEIVNFCRLEKQKNIPLLIDAFEIVHKKYNDYVLSIYGTGKEENSIKEYISKKVLQDCVKVFPPTNEIHNKIIDSKMFVSSSDYEGLSNSMLEAMAIGIPVICTDCPCGGARMIIKNRENGILVPINNKEKLADAMIEIIENKKLAEEISKNGTNIKDMLNEKKVCKIWRDLL